MHTHAHNSHTAQAGNKLGGLGLRCAASVRKAVCNHFTPSLAPPQVNCSHLFTPSSIPCLHLAPCCLDPPSPCLVLFSSLSHACMHACGVACAPCHMHAISHATCHMHAMSHACHVTCTMSHCHTPSHATCKHACLHKVSHALPYMYHVFLMCKIFARTCTTSSTDAGSLQ
jgi:hypothetical protein